MSLTWELIENNDGGLKTFTWRVKNFYIHISPFEWILIEFIVEIINVY